MRFGWAKRLNLFRAFPCGTWSQTSFEFVANQMYALGLVSWVLWMGAWCGPPDPGLWWLGVMYVLYLPGMIALHAKDYYPAPVYPLLFAVGVA